MRSTLPSLPSVRIVVGALATAILVAGVATAKPGGGGGGGRGGRGGGAPGGRSGGPSSPGRNGGPSSPSRGPTSPGPGAPGRGPSGPPRGDAPGPGGAGRPGEPRPAAGAKGPGGPRDVDSFLGTKPASGAAAGKAATSARATSMQQTLAGREPPFTSTWYAAHPTAWQYTHPNAEWWAVAGAAGLSQWLGYSVVAGGTSAGAAPATVVSESGTGTEEPAPAEQPQAAALPEDLDWLPLGVFASAPEGAEQAHVYQQLAVSHDGEIKGNYYDALSDSVQPIAGRIDKESRIATWTIGKGKGGRFQTTIDDLTANPCPATMTSGGGEQRWELVPMDKPADEPQK